MSYTICIGDTHGCLEQLDSLLKEIELYTKSRAIDEYKLIFLGDYIDRGQDSKGVIDRVMQLQERHAHNVITLMGNHEDMMLDVIRGDHPNVWESNGGWITNTSFQVSHPRDIDPKYKIWMKDLPIYHDDGKRFFVHAGVLPIIPLSQNTKNTMLWVREQFLQFKKPWDRYIVHGHTPTKWDRYAPEKEEWVPRVRLNRLNLDTGCVFGGTLTAAVFDDQTTPAIDFLSVYGPVSRSGQY